MPATLPPIRRAPDERVNWVSSIPFLLVHLLCFAVIFTGFTTTAIVLFVAMYFGRAFFVTAAYHRYFSHKAYRLNRFWQFVFAFQAEAILHRYLEATVEGLGPLGDDARRLLEEHLVDAAGHRTLLTEQEARGALSAEAAADFLQFAYATVEQRAQ